MKYMSKAKRDDTLRNYDIDMSIEQHIDDRRRQILDLLDEIEFYPAGL